MPEFIDVASHFNDMQAIDSYTSLPLFMAQFNTFDETSMDGSVNKKRSMSVRPGTVLPARRVLQAMQESWLVGDGNTDGFQGQEVRATYMLKKVTHVASLKTPAQLLRGDTGTSVFVNKDFRKETVNGVTTSEYQPFWDIFTAFNEDVVKGSIFDIGGVIYRARAAYVDLAGFKQAAADQTESWARVTVSYQSGSYNQVTETWSGGLVSVAGLLLEAYMLYTLDNQADPKVNSGDKTLITEKAITVGTKVTIGGKVWTVFTSQPELDAYKHHLRMS